MAEPRPRIGPHHRVPPIREGVWEALRPRQVVFADRVGRVDLAKVAERRCAGDVAATDQLRDAGAGVAAVQDVPRDALAQLLLLALLHEVARSPVAAQSNENFSLVRLRQRPDWSEAPP